MIKGLTIKNGGDALISSFNSSTGIEFSECVLVVEDENYLMESYEGTYFFNNCTFIGPGNGTNDPYVFYDANQINVTNSIFSGFGGIADIGVDISHCLFNKMQIDSNQDISGTNSITQDPLFCDAENGNYGLAANSPALGSDSNGSNIGALGATCDARFVGPVWYVATSESGGLTPMMDRKLLRF